MTAYKTGRTSQAATTMVTNARTRGIAALVEGFFAFVWFGWGQAAAPSWLSVPLGIGSGAGALVALTGAAVAVHAKGQHTPMRDQSARRRYLAIVGVEFGLLGVGAAVGAIAGGSQWIPVWICFGVGAHFVPLARVLAMPKLAPVALIIVAVALAALVTGVASTVAPSTVTGLGTGLVLLVTGILTLLPGRSAYRHPRR
jgi:hypothetical protein